MTTKAITWGRALVAALGVLATLPSFAAATADLVGPVRVIFDTDMYTDVDDTMALAMLHTLQDRGEVELLAVTIGTEAKSIPPYVDAVNTFYGHGTVPIGIVRGGVPGSRFDNDEATYVGNNFATYIAEMTNQDGTLVFPRTQVGVKEVEEATELLRRVFATQPDKSVVLIQVGYSTNFAQLLKSKSDGASALAGRELLARKVKLLSVMAGNFTGGTTSPGEPEFNLRMDIPAAQRIFVDWPTPIVASGSEIGVRMRITYPVWEHDLRYEAHHPVAETLRYMNRCA